MKIMYSNLKLGDELSRAAILHWGHFVFVILVQFYKFFYESIGLVFILPVILLSVFYFFFYKTKRNLFYSFWTFCAVLILYLAFHILNGFFSDQSMTVTLFYLLASTLLFLEMYILYSPIYYPIVSWWEYDFRYRDDLKLKVKTESEPEEGRLTDLRRGAGCIALFHEFEIGNKLELEAVEGFGELNLTVEIMSKRQYSIGRPINYGVKVMINSIEEKNTFLNLKRYWNVQKREIKNQKLGLTSEL